MPKRKKTSIEPIYDQYKSQIDGIVELTDFNYTKAAKIVAWLYGGSSERWRKVLTSKKSTPAIPREIKELLGKLETKQHTEK